MPLQICKEWDFVMSQSQCSVTDLLHLGAHFPEVGLQQAQLHVTSLSVVQTSKSEPFKKIFSSLPDQADTTKALYRVLLPASPM